jgi:hypothetical protein
MKAIKKSKASPDYLPHLVEAMLAGLLPSQASSFIRNDLKDVDGVADAATATDADIERAIDLAWNFILTDVETDPTRLAARDLARLEMLFARCVQSQMYADALKVLMARQKLKPLETKKAVPEEIKRKLELLKAS